MPLNLKCKLELFLSLKALTVIISRTEGIYLFYLSLDFSGSYFVRLLICVERAFVKKVDSIYHSG